MVVGLIGTMHEKTHLECFFSNHHQHLAYFKYDILYGHFYMSMHALIKRAQGRGQ